MKKTKIIMISFIVVLMTAFCIEVGLAAEAKLADNITPKEVSEMLKEDTKVIIIDVRSQPEFQFVGYIEGAYNIPYWFVTNTFTPKDKDFEFAPGKVQKAKMSRYQFRENPDFMTHVKKLAKPTDTVVVYCGSSKRSAMAADALVKAGYEDVSNMLKGFSGGWVKENLPYKEMFKVKTIDPKFVYPPDVAK